MRAIDRFETGHDAALALRPDAPVYCFRPSVLAADARAFIDAFPGKTAYAVKTNGEPFVLRDARRSRHQRLRRCEPRRVRSRARRLAEGGAPLHASGQGAVRHPARARDAIGMRVLALDHEDEIAKLLRIVRALDLDPADITLFVRLQTQGAGRLRAVAEIRRGAVACGGAAAAHRPDRLPRRPLLPCRQPDRGSRRSMSGRSPPPTGSGAAPACSLPGSTSAAASRRLYGHDPRRAGKPMPSFAELMAELRRRHRRMGLFRPAAHRRARPRHRRALALRHRARASEEGAAALHQ